jgi:cytochrome c-type biogenesis protein CcmE
MHKKTKNRLFGILSLMFCLSIGTYIILSKLNDNIVFFYPPSELVKISSSMTKVRVGGLVKENSIVQITDQKIKFVITDNIADLTIEYEGVLPVLFREKQGIIAEGTVSPTNIFLAKNLLAKHDENYMPPEIQRSLAEPIPNN